MSGTATYVYALVQASGGVLGEICGISGQPIRVVGRDRLSCVVSTVDLDEFGDEALPRNLADLGWLERVAREHDAVVQAADEALTVLPLRLGTVCADDDSAVRRAEELRVPAQAALDLVTGRAEWGVKLYAVARRPTELVSVAERPASGLEYLRRRRAEVDRRAVDVAAAAADADSVFEQLGGRSVLGKRHRLQDPALSGVAHPMLLNAAFLVDRDQTEQFRAAVGRLAAERDPGSLVLTGPWPPYSFASVEDA